MHVEGEPDGVAGCEDVRKAVDVGGDVMWLLGLEEGKKGLERFREHKWFAGWRRDGRRHGCLL